MIFLVSISFQESKSIASTPRCILSIDQDSVKSAIAMSALSAFFLSKAVSAWDHRYLWSLETYDSFEMPT